MSCPASLSLVPWSARRKRPSGLFGATVACFLAGLVAVPRPAEAQPSSQSSYAAPAITATPSWRLDPVTVVRGLDHPWSIAFLPGPDAGLRALVTERTGKLRVADLSTGTLSEPVAGVPTVHARGQGGLLDVALDPSFASNQLIYWSYSEPGDGGSGIAVARARLDASRKPSLQGLQVIFREKPKVSGNANLGARLVFGPDGKLFISVGDRFNLRDEAQSLAVSHGKVMRIEPDGRIPSDNPFVGRAGALPEIYSYGHRNPQGVAINPVTGVLWTQEHGPQGGDEVNVTQAGRNYGWPVITYGAEYVTGLKIGEGTAKEGMEQPVAKWVPSIAPSGMAFLTSERYPGWKGSLFLGALKAQMLVRLTLDGDKVTGEQHLLTDFGERLRDVRQGPDGYLYVLTDNSEGRVVRLQPQP